MAVRQASKVLHCIRTLALHQSDSATDGDLLDLYLRLQDEAAFEALVRRHGRMVLGVCRRILGNSHDAEDAFQATFLVLVRKATSIRPAGMVGNWLYGVAHRTALEARRSIARRRSKESHVVPRPEPSEDTLARLRPLLELELPRLPDKYRAALVLCDLEGRTRKEVAQQLGLPEGTIASRLSRARTILAKRLARHRLTITGGALAAAMAQEAASAAAPLSLVVGTVRAAVAYAAGPAAAAAIVSAQVAAITEGVMKTMLLSKLKIGVVLLAAIGIAGTGWGNYRTLANDQPADQEVSQVASTAAQPPAGTQIELDRFLQDEGKKTSDAKKPQEPDKNKQLLDLLLERLQAFPDSKARADQRPDKNAADPYKEAFLMAFQISNDIARAMSTKAPGATGSPDQDQVKQVLELLTKGLEANQAPKRKDRVRADKESMDLNVDAFLKAFQVSSELAKANAKPQPRLRPEDQQILSSCGPAFLRAYERAHSLKKALEGQKAVEGRQGEKTLEALDMFLKAGKDFEQAVRQNARTQAVHQARQDIQNVLSKVEQSTNDRRTQLETLEEIERLVEQMKKKLQQSKESK